MKGACHPHNFRNGSSRLGGLRMFRWGTRTERKPLARWLHRRRRCSSSGISDTYSEYFDAAWKEAGEGISPTNNCARFFGMAMGLIKYQNIEGQDRADVIKAMDACYVGATGRFVNAKLSEADVGMAGCRGLFTALRVNRSTLGSFLKDVGEDQAAYDSRLNERIGDKVRSACPDLADGILGT